MRISDWSSDVALPIYHRQLHLLHRCHAPRRAAAQVACTDAQTESHAAGGQARIAVRYNDPCDRGAPVARARTAGVRRGPGFMSTERTNMPCIRATGIR